MNKLIHSQSLQSPFSVAGASQVAATEHPLPDEMAFDGKGGNHFVVIPVADVDKPVMNALHYARLLCGQAVAVHILLGSSEKGRIEDQWKMLNIDIPLLVLDSPNDSVIEPLNEFVYEIRQRDQRNSVTILLPVILGLKWWQRFLHNQTARSIERALQPKAGVVTVRVPFFLAKTEKEKRVYKRG